MKNLFLLALLAMSTIFVSCDGDEIVEPVDTETFVATIDGNSFEASTVVAISDDSFGETIIFMSGTEATSGYAIGINIPVSLTIGETSMVDESDIGITFTDTEQNTYITVGQIIPTKIDTTNMTVAGTFSFTATQQDDDTNVVEITAGEYNATYQ